MGVINLAGDLTPTFLTILLILLFSFVIYNSPYVPVFAAEDNFDNTHDFDNFDHIPTDTDWSWDDINDDDPNTPRRVIMENFLPEFPENHILLTVAIIYIIATKEYQGPLFTIFTFFTVLLIPSSFAEYVTVGNYTTSCVNFDFLEKYKHGCSLDSGEQGALLGHFINLDHNERYYTSLPHCEFLNLTMREQDIDCTFTPEEHEAALGWKLVILQFLGAVIGGHIAMLILGIPINFFQYWSFIYEYFFPTPQPEVREEAREALLNLQNLMVQHQQQIDQNLEPQAGNTQTMFDIKPYEKYVSLAVHSLGFYNDLSRYKSESIKRQILNLVFSCIRFMLNFFTLSEAANHLSTVFEGKLRPKHFLEAQSGLPRQFLNNWDSLAAGELTTKMKHVLVGLISCPLVKQFGLEFNVSNLKNFISIKKTDLNFTSGPEMVRSVLDLIVTFGETGYECFASRSFQPILIQNRFVRKWLHEFHELSVEIAEKPITMEFSAVVVLAKIDNLISRGSQLLHNNPVEVRPCWRILMERRVKLLQEHNVAAPRKPPFSFLVYGSPGIGKSTIMQNIGTLYHRVVVSEGIYPDLTWDPAVNMYNRNGKDNFWSGYKGVQHYFVIIDDMGREHPNHVASGKATSLDDVIDVVNTIPVGSNQAGIEDKGAIPIVPMIFGASTNTKNLNAHLAVAEASAILRRMPIVIEPILKPEYLDTVTGMMKKLTAVVHDAWDYRVEEVRLEKVLKKIQIRYDPVLGTGPDGTLTGAEFSKFMTKKIIEHEASSKVMMEGNKVDDSVQLCEHGVLSYYDCKDCNLEVQAWYHKLPAFKKPSFRERAMRRCAHFAIDWLPYESYERFIPHNTKFFTAVCDERLDRGLSPMTIAARDLLLCLTASGMLYMVLSYLIRFIMPSKKEDPIDAQADEEKRNIWALLAPAINERFSLPRVHKSNNLAEITNTITKSVFRLAIQNGETASEVTAFCLRDGWYVTVSHPFLEGDEWRCVALYPSQYSTNLTPQRGFVLEKEFIKFLDNDLVVFSNSSLLPRKALFSFLPRFTDKRGRSFRIFDQRFPFLGEGSSTVYVPLSYKNDNNRVLSGHFMEAIREDRPPMKGDCGAIILSEANSGYYISGIHCAGAPNGSSKRMIITQVAQEMFDHLDAPILALSGFSDMKFIENGSSASGPLKLPHASKGVHHWATGNAIVLGSYSRRITSSSRTKNSIICQEIEEEFGIENPFVAPLMLPEKVGEDWHNPFTIAAQSQANLSPHFKDSELIRCAEAFIVDLTVDVEWLKEAGPVDLQVAINGINGDTYMNRIPMSTSGGFYFPGAKFAYFDEVIEDGFPVAYAKPEILEMIAAIEENYLLGNRACVLFNGTLKDEPVKQSKRDEGKTRVFTACDVAFSLVVRKMFLGLTKAIMTNNFITECMVGLNCYSKDWDALYKFLTKFGKEFVFDGDFREFDKSMAANVMRTAFYVLQKLLEIAGITHKDAMIIQGIITDICFPIVNMNGDVIQFFGGNPSGTPLTVIINSFVNSIYMRLAYSDVDAVENFKKNVNLATLGDDNVGNSALSVFNHTQISNFLAARGVGYTMADKTSESIPFHNISEVDFLKRSFVIRDGVAVGPLALNSVFKSLMMYVDKGNISHEEQLSQSYLAARREWSLHGKVIFDEYTRKMEKILISHPEIKRFCLPQHSLTYEETSDWVQGE